MASCVCDSAALICAGMSSKPSAFVDIALVVFGRDFLEKIFQIRLDVGTAFSWISSEAEVWRQKSVRRPVETFCARSQRDTSALISTRPLPPV